MQGFRRRPLPVGWGLALVFGLVLAACGGSGGLTSDIAAAELWDPRTGEVIARPQAREALTAAAFEQFVRAEPARAAQLQMAQEMGYGTVRAAERVTYDDGTVMTTAALAGEGSLALLITGAMRGDGEAAETVESSFIAEPVYEGEELVRIDFSSEQGELSLDLTTGEVELARAEYGSCSTWNCLAGAIFFWWEDNSAAMDAYWGLAGEACMDCIALPHSAPVACPICAAFLGAVVLASVTDCTIWPCDLCVSDSCHMPEYENQHCVTENGVSEVRQSVTRWVCEHPRTQQAECVPGTPITETERCPWGCRPGSPTCMWSMQCMVRFNLCPSILQGTWCVGDDLTRTYQKQACVSDDPVIQNEWGSCIATGQLEHETQACPYTCTNYSSPSGGFEGQCDPPPTCDPTICERFRRPVGEPYCMVRPDDERSVMVREVEPYGCVAVEPRAPVPADWPEGKTCQALDRTLQVVEECPTVCTADGVSCATTSQVILQTHLPAGDGSGPGCAACYVRLVSPDDVYLGMTRIDGRVFFEGIPHGQYRVEYGCGPTDQGAHLPSDVYPGQPARFQAASPSWPPGNQPAVVNAPLSDPMDVYLGSCNP